MNISVNKEPWRQGAPQYQRLLYKTWLTWVYQNAQIQISVDNRRRKKLRIFDKMISKEHGRLTVCLVRSFMIILSVVLVNPVLLWNKKCLFVSHTIFSISANCRSGENHRQSFIAQCGNKRQHWVAPGVCKFSPKLLCKVDTSRLIN